MTGVRYEDLPAALRAQVDAKLDQPKRPKRGKGGGTVSGGGPWSCHECDARFTVWAKAERHMDSHGGGRLALILERD